MAGPRVALVRWMRRVRRGTRRLRAGLLWPRHGGGEVPERSNGAVSKTVVRASVPRVRIPSSPPFVPCHNPSLIKNAIPYTVEDSAHPFNVSVLSIRRLLQRFPSGVVAGSPQIVVGRVLKEALSAEPPAKRRTKPYRGPLVGSLHRSGLTLRGSMTFGHWMSAQRQWLRRRWDWRRRDLQS